jgi:CheY-like chemotaxis protein
LHRSLLEKGEIKPMDTESLLKDKIVLAVDDEVDVTDTIVEVLDMCLVRKANDYETARQLFVILDIMGVNGFELLKTSVKRGFPTVMLTAYALTPEALEKSIKLGAVSFLPKEKMSDLDEFLADVVLKGGQPVWGKLFDKASGRTGNSATNFSKTSSNPSNRKNKQNPVLKPPSRSTAKDFDFPYQSLDLKNLTFTGHR